MTMTSTARYRIVLLPHSLPMQQVFFQQKAFNSIEKLRTTIVSRSATIVQTFWRGVSCRRAFLIRKGALRDRRSAKEGNETIRVQLYWVFYVDVR